MFNYLKRNPHIIYIFGILLLFPALLINLGLVNIFLGVDEATRALVAVEMILSDNFITPTINGEFYYNKPPLFNWILVFFFKNFGISEFVLRLPTVISLFGFGLTIFFFVKKQFGTAFGALTAFVFVTSGRILFWESFFGYIDITFSWMVYTGMMFIFYFYQKKKYYQLFIISYVFAAIAFMLKGLPAMVFQGITLLVLFLSERKFKKLFSLAHVTGGLIFILIVGSYYLIYHFNNSLENVFTKLWHETTQRTVVEQGWWNTVKHLFEFPVEMTYHYAPWSFLIIFTFQKRFWKTVWNNQFLKFNLLVFLFNIILYWTSPDVYPKYIMMLMPLLFTVYLYFFKISLERKKVPVKIFHGILIVASVLLTVGMLTIPFIEKFSVFPDVWLKSIFLFIIAAMLTFLLFKLRRQRIIIFSLILIVTRIGFDWFIWPQRAPQYERYENDAVKIAEITKDEKLYYYKAPMLQYGASFYISVHKNDIVRQEHKNPKSNIFYIVDDGGLDEITNIGLKYKIFYQYPNVEDGRKLNLIKIINLSKNE